MKITAMAFQRKEVEQKIKSLAPVFAEHIVKMFLYPNSQYVKGWEKELKAWYETVRTYGHSVKGGKSLSKDRFFDCLYLPVKSSIKKMYPTIVLKNQELTPSYKKEDLAVLDTMVGGLYLMIAEALSNNKDWLLVARDVRILTLADDD